MNVTGGLPLRGKTWLSGNSGRTLTSNMSDHLEGTTKVFDDMDPAVTSGARTRRSNRQCTCMLVRNVSAGVLLPKRVVTFKAGYFGKQVDGYCDVGAELCAGVVDEFVSSAGVAVNDLFWITVKGPTLMLTDLAGGANNPISELDRLVALTAATSGATTAGRVVTQSLAGATGVLAGAIQNSFGVAMSAKTTANTNADILVDSYFMK